MRKASLWAFKYLICLPAIAQQDTEQEKNKAVARSFFEEVLDQGRFDKYAESHTNDFVAHAGDHKAKLQEDIAAAKEERKALPDMHVKVNQMLAERDMVGSVLDCIRHQHGGRAWGFPQRQKNHRPRLFRSKQERLRKNGASSIWEQPCNRQAMRSKTVIPRTSEEFAAPP
jgi:predicted SnoaL-like aldol condensation-catalyzing enzyme